MKEYNSIDRIQDDGYLLGEQVWAYNKLDGQNFRVKYNPRSKEFGPFGSRTQLVDETSDQFGNAVRYFNEHKYGEILSGIVKNNSGKKGLFTGVDEITFFFEWYGDNSFAGFHQDGDTMHLALIDVFLKKKGYIEPESFETLFRDCGIEIPELIYKGVLTQNSIGSIQKNDWTSDACEYPTVKEGVVCRRSTMLKGQRMPKVKFKTQWWLTKLYEKYDEDTARKLE